MDGTSPGLWSSWKEEDTDSKENVREQRSEFFISNERESIELQDISGRNSASTNISVGSSKRQRGRPRKNPDVSSRARISSKKADPDYVEPDSPIDSDEERNDSGEEFKDDDPEFDPDQRCKKTRRLNLLKCGSK
uniref:SNF2 domain-containing protein CLASSY 3-like n=1 Tax=Heterorhabditis bacteriophora TaxID=37862 RepID=A0A1I7XH63_HETBA